MIGQHVAATRFAPLSKAVGRLVVRPELLGALGDLHGVGLPQDECVHRARGPSPARSAMTVSHARRLAGHAELDGSAEAASLVRRFAHVFLVRVFGLSCIVCCLGLANQTSSTTIRPGKIYLAQGAPGAPKRVPGGNDRPNRSART